MVSQIHMSQVFVFLLSAIIGVEGGSYCYYSSGYEVYCLWGCCYSQPNGCCGMPAGAIAGVILGCLFFVLTVIAVIIYLRRRRRQTVIQYYNHPGPGATTVVSTNQGSGGYGSPGTVYAAPPPSYGAVQPPAYQPVKGPM